MDEHPVADPEGETDRTDGEDHVGESTTLSMAAGEADDGSVRDRLPEGLDITATAGPYIFPDNSRRRIPGMLYLTVAAVTAVVSPGDGTRLRIGRPVRHGALSNGSGRA